MLKELKIRALKAEEQPRLINWLKKAEVVGATDLPHGFIGASTQTAVAEHEGKVLLSLTSTKAVVLGPLIKDPDGKPIELMASVLHAARALEFLGSLDGATEAYIVVSNDLPAFQRIVERAGYEQVAQNCKIYRRLLLSDDAVRIVEEEERAPETVEETAEAPDEDSSQNDS